jgi:hypothetical protein
MVVLRRADHLVKASPDPTTTRGFCQQDYNKTTQSLPLQPPALLLNSTLSEVNRQRLRVEGEGITKVKVQDHLYC